MSAEDRAALNLGGRPTNDARRAGLPAGDHTRSGCYHDVMTRKATTVRIPEELADTAEVLARARGVSVNTLIIDALQREVDRVKDDKEFMAVLRSHVQRDKEILDRLAE